MIWLSHTHTHNITQRHIKGIKTNIQTSYSLYTRTHTHKYACHSDKTKTQTSKLYVASAVTCVPTNTDKTKKEHKSVK